MKREKYTLLDRLIIPDYDTQRGVHSGNLGFDKEKCKECGICITLCPGGCLLTDRATKVGLLSGEVKGGKYGVPHVDKARRGATLCIACYDCGAACPHDAISIETQFQSEALFQKDHADIGDDLSEEILVLVPGDRCKIGESVPFFSPVLNRGKTGDFLEVAVKVGQVVEPHVKGDVDDLAVGLIQQLLGRLDALGS